MMKHSSSVGIPGHGCFIA